MTTEQFAVEILGALPFTPNAQQMQVGRALARFCARDDNDPADRVFVLNGYAGTGKTSLTAALVKALSRVRVQTALLAPTGRAARVFASMAGHDASTIHRRIYRHSLAGGPAGPPPPRENKSEHTIFIVDEASMIAADTEQGSNILADLVQYVYSGIGCKMILLGDTAQLPPVGSEISPAMDRDTLRSFGLKVTMATLTEVARQDAMSGILLNATRMRRARTLPPPTPERGPVPLVAPLPDVVCVEGGEMPDVIDEAYRRDGLDQTIVITRSNRSATDFNRGIRSAVLGREEELAVGELLIAVKNNYHWGKRTEFIANGEILRLERVIQHEVRYGMRFADVVLSRVDDPEKEITAKIVLACLQGDAAALDRESYERLYRGVYNDADFNRPDDPHEVRVRRLRESPYWNALQVKYAYAVTCHKAQGGQWANVFVDLSYIPPEQTGPEFYRWLYTAVTRARRTLYLINPPELLVREPR